MVVAPRRRTRNGPWPFEVVGRDARSKDKEDRTEPHRSGGHMPVVAVITRDTAEKVLLEASRHAATYETDVHVVYVVGLSWYSAIELNIANSIGFPTGSETIKRQTESLIERLADPVLDEYEAVGLMGRPSTEILEYAASVGAECIVIDAKYFEHPLGLIRDSISNLEEGDIPVEVV